VATLLDPSIDVSTLTDEQLLEMTSQVLALQEKDRQEFALRYYEPANETIGKLHSLTCGIIGIFGGNRSGKTEHALVEGIIRCTGIIPESLKASYPRQKLRGPIKMRVTCESLTTVLDPIILPKLQWWSWSGVKPQGGEKGHWGWIPRHCLIGGDWKKSYNSRLRMLTLIYHDPDTGRPIGPSYIQFMSYDQDPSDFASGDVNYNLHDEPPPHAIWKENRARCMGGGDGSTMIVSMTWPDNPAAPVDWIFDEIFDKGSPGPAKDPDVEVINIYTTMNKHLDQDKVTSSAAQMTKMEKDTRIYGLPIRFSNRIHPDFTDQPKTWCYECGKVVLLTTEGNCHECDSNYVSEFCHVEPLESVSTYPCVCLLDPHPRKPHFLAWVQITPNEDYETIKTLQVEGGAEDVRDAVKEVEDIHQWYSVSRLMDPNMGASPSGAKRELTWQMEFDNVGLHFDLADDSGVGRSRLNDFLKPDKIFMRPRFRINTSCTDAIFQMKRYVWDDPKKSERKDIKQVPLQKHDDYPALFKYLMNRLPTSGNAVPRVHRRNRS
jgi:hypothetical protein